jgi:hypothetical protein
VGNVIEKATFLDFPLLTLCLHAHAAKEGWFRILGNFMGRIAGRVKDGVHGCDADGRLAFNHSQSVFGETSSSLAMATLLTPLASTSLVRELMKSR